MDVYFLTHRVTVVCLYTVNILNFIYLLLNNELVLQFHDNFQFACDFFCIFDNILLMIFKFMRNISLHVFLLLLISVQGI